jgi:DNA ligase-1
MNTLLHFKKFYEEIKSSNSRKYKQDILQKYKDDEIIQKYLKIAFDPYTVYGISIKKLYKDVRVGDVWCAPTVFDLFDYLTVHNTGRDLDVAVCQLAINWLASDDQEAARLLEFLICKEFVIGCDAKTINSVMPGTIRQFSVQLANKYFDNPKKLEGKEFAITTKLDGFRLIAMKDETGNVSFYSRVGQRIEGLVEIEEELKTGFPEGTVLDGELTISNYFDMPSKEAYKAASKIIRLKGDTPKRGLTYRVFDGMHIDEWRSQNCTHTYDERRNLLEGLFGYTAAPIPHIEFLPVLYRGNDTSKITEILEEIIAAGGEGCMCNVCDAPYRFTRTWDLVKVKKFNSLDLLVVDMEEGSGRLAGTLGAIHVRYKDGNIVKVGSGFSDEERKLYWAQPDLILNKIVEVKYFESSRNADGTESLRFPTWVSNIRDPRDKATPDF